VIEMFYCDNCSNETDKPKTISQSIGNCELCGETNLCNDSNSIPRIIKQDLATKTGFKKYPKIYRLGHEDNLDILKYGDDFITVEEKIDGGNGSFWLEEDGIHFGSRNRDLTSAKDLKTFGGFQLKLREHLKDKEVNPDYIYYFEWMQKHTITYTRAPFIIGLDIRLRHSAISEGCGMFLGSEGKHTEFKRLEIEPTPIIWQGKVKDFKKLKVDDVVPKSKYYDGFAEGIVIKNYMRKSTEGNHQLFAKVVREEFKESNKAVFGGIRQKESDSDKIVERYMTDARIKKHINKLVLEDNNPLDRALMRWLPINVIKDVMKEESDEIFTSYTFIDFRQMKQLTAKVCLRVINEIMLEKAKGEE
jgi:hypothetical protein